MKSHFIRRNNKVYSQSFSVKHEKLPHFLNLWHYHQELELVFILKGEGTRFIGDSIEPFKPGELVLLGDYLPHKWLNKPEYFKGKDLITEGIIIHFEKYFLANAINETIEFSCIQQLIEESKRGILFGDSDEILVNVALKLKEIVLIEPGLERMLKLLDVLRILANDKEKKFITSTGFINSVYDKDVKLRKVNEYVMNNFQAEISLKDVAEEVCMNTTAFCRYFKKATNKNFSTYVNEVRIGYACKLLQNNEHKTILEICYGSGFSNLSNFNHKFKLLTGYTPTAYVKMVN